MTVRLSTGSRNGLAQGLGFGGMFNGGRIEIYSGSQPATADAAATGTLLGTVTSGSGALTKETRATATLTVTGGAGTLTFGCSRGDSQAAPRRWRLYSRTRVHRHHLHR